jgi:hypothetical protein
VNDIAQIMSSLTPANWIAIAGIAIAVLLWLATQYLTARRERLKTYEPTPIVNATINRKSYREGWRSVQLHVVPVPEQQPIKYENWRIERATLLRPWSAVLARAEKDDYASEVFYPENPTRALQGKVKGLPQQFALEFFIKFKGNDRGQKAKFKISFAHTTMRRRYTTKVWATVPLDAE